MKRNDYVTVLVIRQQGETWELLQAKRCPEKYLGGTWQFIAGGLEPDETAWEGALRELREETTLVPREFYRLSTLTRFYRPENDTLNTSPMFCAIVDASDEVTINDEHTDFRWVELESAERDLMWPGDRLARDEVESVIVNNGLAKEFLRIPLTFGQQK